ncbi:MAG: 30S ribosomal protein S9 [Patescibacteria group bacterium]
MAEKKTYVSGVGRRKSAVALVRLSPGKGHHTVDGKPLAEHFTLESWRNTATGPLRQLGQAGKFDLSIRVRGGGLPAQADAVRLGVARALVTSDPDVRTTLKKEGFLTRDARVKERRKYGLKKARKAPQFSKR